MKDFRLFGRKRFIQFLAKNHVDDLRRLGIPEDHITLMREEGKGPEGYTVHHKMPRHGGGGNDIDNLILMPPKIHKEIHEAIDVQILHMSTGDSRMVDLPMPDGVIYMGHLPVFRLEPRPGSPAFRPD